MNPEDNRRLSVYPHVEVEPTADVCPSGPSRDAGDQGRDGRIIWAGSRSEPARQGRGRGRSFDSGHGNGRPAHPRNGRPASMAQSCRDLVSAGTTLPIQLDRSTADCLEALGRFPLPERSCARGTDSALGEHPASCDCKGRLAGVFARATAAALGVAARGPTGGAPRSPPQHSPLTVDTPAGIGMVPDPDVSVMTVVPLEPLYRMNAYGVNVATGV